MDYAVSAEHLSLSLGGRDILRDVTLSIETGSITGRRRAQWLRQEYAPQDHEPHAATGQGDDYYFRTGHYFLQPAGAGSSYRRVASAASGSRRHDGPRIGAHGAVSLSDVYRPASSKDELYVEKALHAVRLEDKADAVVQQLSGGEQQRVWLAMLLAQRSSILYLDEPTTYLDMRHQLHMMRLLNHINEKLGLTIVVVLHDMNQALQYTQQAIVMKDGEIVCTGRTADVLTPDLMRRVFGVQAELVQMSDGRRALIPLGLER